MDEYSQLGTTALVSPMTKSLLGVQKKKRTSDRERRESKHGRQKGEAEKKDAQGRIMLSREGDRSRSVGGSDDEVSVEYGPTGPKQRVRKKVDLVI